MTRFAGLFPLIAVLAVGCVHIRPREGDDPLSLEQLNERLAQKEATVSLEDSSEVRAFHVQIGADLTTWTEGGVYHHIPSHEVVRVTIRHHGKGFLEGMGIGLLVGVLGGTIFGYASGDDPACEGPGFCFDLSAETKAAIGAIFFGIVGSPIGGIIGAAVGSKEHYLIGPSLSRALQNQTSPPTDPASATLRR